MRHPAILCLLMALAAGALGPGVSRAVTLEEAVRTAGERSPTLQAAESRIASARALLRQARSYDFPSLSASASYTGTDNPPQAFMMALNQRSLDMTAPGFNPNEPDDTDNLRGSLNVRWRLFDRSRDESQRMAGHGADASIELHAAARNRLVYEVTRGYYGVLQAQSFASVQQEAVKSFEESLRVARERFAAGGAVKTDVLNLETQLAQAREDLIRARNGVRLSLAALNAAIGLDLVTADNIEPPGLSALDAPPPECREPEAYLGRPEMRAATLMRLVREADLRRARGGYAPTLSAFGSLDADSGNARDFENSYMAGVAAEVNLFDGARTRAAVQAAHADLAAARAEEERAKLDLRLDLQQAFLGAQEAWERLEVTRKSAETAEEARRIVQEQYRQGAADIAVLLQTQVGVTAMQTRHAAARYDYLTALSNLQRAKGELGKAR
jgi:outer membrane protein